MIWLRSSDIRPGSDSRPSRAHSSNKSLYLSELQRRLLVYLVEKSLARETDDLKEYTIGVDAFGKPPSYDPRQESVVRMHLARLRQKLTDYYHTDGAIDPTIADLPKGGFWWRPAWALDHEKLHSRKHSSRSIVQLASNCANSGILSFRPRATGGLHCHSFSGTATGAFRLRQFLGPRKPDLLVTYGAQLGTMSR
jgi:hypothetical protein